jgi:hypothetical protein
LQRRAKRKRQHTTDANVQHSWALSWLNSI